MFSSTQGCLLLGDMHIILLCQEYRDKCWESDQMCQAAKRGKTSPFHTKYVVESIRRVLVKTLKLLGNDWVNKLITIQSIAATSSYFAWEILYPHAEIVRAGEKLVQELGALYHRVFHCIPT